MLLHNDWLHLLQLHSVFHLYNSLKKLSRKNHYPTIFFWCNRLKRWFVRQQLLDLSLRKNIVHPLHNTNWYISNHLHILHNNLFLWYNEKPNWYSIYLKVFHSNAIGHDPDCNYLPDLYKIPENYRHYQISLQQNYTFCPQPSKLYLFRSRIDTFFLFHQKPRL